MIKENCNKFDTCSAPICPLSPDQDNNNYLWYPNEEICMRHNSLFVKNQKKIAQRTKDTSTYYTFEMLKRNCIIKEGITGLSPDQAEAVQLKAWFVKHPVKKELSEDQRNVMRERFAKVSKKSVTAGILSQKIEPAQGVFEDMLPG